VGKGCIDAFEDDLAGAAIDKRVTSPTGEESAQLGTTVKSLQAGRGRTKTR
jgi:hypothetical protein